MATITTLKKLLDEVSIPRLAEASGVDFTVIYRIKRHPDPNPKLSTIEALLAAMGKSLAITRAPARKPNRRK